MSKKETVLNLEAYILPDFNPANDKHLAISIDNELISEFNISTTTNTLRINAELIFIDNDQGKIMPYIMHKFPPLIKIFVNEYEVEENSLKFLDSVVEQIFMIDNIDFENINFAGSNKAYAIKLKLVSTHSLAFETRPTNYSNHDTKWKFLNLENDIAAILNRYISLTGKTIKYNGGSSGILGIPISNIKRRFASGKSERPLTSLLKVIKQSYMPAINEKLISETFDKELANLISNKLIGFSIDKEDSNINFYRLDADETYSVPIIPNERLNKILPLRFEKSHINEPISISLHKNNSNIKMLSNIGINHKHIYFDNQRIMIKTFPNILDRKNLTSLYEETDIIEQVEKYILAKELPAIKLPKKPISSQLYNNNLLKGYLFKETFSGMNTYQENPYDIMLDEIFKNNSIYLSLENMLGHKPGQVVHLAVQELTGNDPILNYNLNLAFAGAWKILSSRWIFKKVEEDKNIKFSEVLQLGRFSKLIGDEKFINDKTELSKV